MSAIWPKPRGDERTGTASRALKINDLEFFLLDDSAESPRATTRSLLVRLATDGGEEGWGEVRLAWRTEELTARRDALLPSLVGRSAFDVEDLARCDALKDAALRAAVETAAWDLVGRACGQPLCHLFGGFYRGRVPVAARLPDESAGRVARVAEELAERGLHTQIVSSRGEAEADGRLLSTVREAVEERSELRLDGGGNYEFDAARELCDSLEGEGIQLLVDPLAQSDAAGLVALRNQTTLPLAVARGLRRPADALQFARRGVSLVVDPQRVGGLAAARRCAAVAEAADVSATLATSSGWGIAAAALLHLAASTPNFAGANECPCHLARDVLAEPLDFYDGLITVPQASGLGIEVDRAKLEQFQVSSS